MNALTSLRFTGDANAEFSLNGGPFSKESDVTLKPGSHTLTARLVTSGSGSTPVSASFTIGSQTLAFTATTRADVIAPTGTISFPPKISLTEGATVIMRGTVKDEANGSGVKSVKINNQTATFDADKGTWELKAATLTPGSQVLTLNVEDGAGNSSRAASVNIMQGDTNITFPERSGVDFVGPQTVAWDNLDGRNRALVMDVDAKALIAVDLNTGKREVLSDNTTQPEIPFIYEGKGYNAGSIVLDRKAGKVYAGLSIDVDNLESTLDHSIIGVDVKTGGRSFVSSNVSYETAEIVLENTSAEYRIFSGDSKQDYINVWDLNRNEASNYSSSSLGIPNSINPFNNVGSIAIDSPRKRLLVTSLSGDQFVFSVDIASPVSASAETKGARSIFSDASVPNNENQFTQNDNYVLTSIRVDADRSRALMVDRLKPAIFELALSDDKTKDGARSVFSDNATANKLTNPYGLHIESGMPYALLVDKGTKALMAVDLLSGERVFISKTSVN